MIRGLWTTGSVVLIACAVPESWTATGPLPQPSNPVVVDVPGFGEDGSYLVKEDGAAPSFVISPPICTCVGMAATQFQPRPSFRIAFTELVMACAEGDLDIEIRTRVPLIDAKRASNYRRVAECLATRVHIGCVDTAVSLARDPCPALLGTGWRLPQRGELARLSDSQRRAVQGAFSPAGDGFFSSLTVLALDEQDTFFAVDLSPNGTMAPVWSKSSGRPRTDTANFRATQPFAARCVRPAGDHPAPPPLNSTATSCLLLASLGKPGQVSERERMTKEAAMAQAARPLYPSVIAFRAEADRVRTMPELDAAAIRREIARIEPELQRIRDYFKAHESLGPRYFAVHRELAEVVAETQTAPPGRREEMERKKLELQGEADSLLLANYADDGELRNQGAIKGAIEWLARRVLADHRDIEEQRKKLQTAGQPVPDALESRRALLSGLLDDIHAHDPFVWRYR